MNSSDWLYLADMPRRVIFRVLASPPYQSRYPLCADVFSWPYVSRKISRDCIYHLIYIDEINVDVTTRDCIYRLIVVECILLE